MEIPGVDIVMGTHGRDRLLEYVEQVKKDAGTDQRVSNIMKQREFEEMDVPTFSQSDAGVTKNSRWLQ